MSPPHSNGSPRFVHASNPFYLRPSSDTPIVKSVSESDFIQDIVECMENAPRHVAGMSYEEMLGDRKTLLAVRSEVLMLGEAASRLPREVRDRHPEVLWRDIISTRNRVVHAYDRIDYEIVWKILQESIPRDLPLGRAMLEDEKKRRNIEE